MRRAGDRSVEDAVGRAADIFQEGVFKGDRVACHDTIVCWLRDAPGDSGTSRRNGSARCARLISVFRTQCNVISSIPRRVTSTTGCDGSVGAGKEGWNKITDGGRFRLDSVGQLLA